jgi:hypothetical protein
MLDTQPSTLNPQPSSLVPLIKKGSPVLSVSSGLASRMTLPVSLELELEPETKVEFDIPLTVRPSRDMDERD